MGGAACLAPDRALLERQEALERAGRFPHLHHKHQPSHGCVTPCYTRTATAPALAVRRGLSGGYVSRGGLGAGSRPHTLAALSLPPAHPLQCLHRRALAGKVWISRGFAGVWRYMHGESKKHSMPHRRRWHLANLLKVTRRFWRETPSFRRYESLRQCRIKSGCRCQRRAGDSGHSFGRHLGQR